MNTPAGISLPDRIGRGSQGGFTLIELIVVLLIFAVLAGVTAPALFAPHRAVTGMEEAVGRFDALFRLARDSAVRSARPVTIVMDSISGLVWFDVPGGYSGGIPQGYPSSGGNTTPDVGIRSFAGGALGGGSSLGQGLGAPGAGVVVPADAQPLTLPEGIRVTYFHLRSLFTFTPAGSAMGDSLLLRSDIGQQCLVTIDPWSGRVRVR